MSGFEGALNVNLLTQWAHENEQDPALRVLSTILSRTAAPVVAARRQAQIADIDVFNIDIQSPVGPIPDQKDSGRCWIFSLLNCMRLMAAKKLDLEEFELSDAYIYFYDRLSKAKTFLRQMVATAHLPIDSRLVSTLMSSGGVQDGGDFDSAISLVSTYGIVPKHVFPESWSSDHTASLDNLLSSKLREYGLDLRKAVMEHGPTSQVVEDMIAAQVKKIMHVAVVTLGMPPLPAEKFIWEYRDKHGKVRSAEHTPLSFAKVMPLDLWESAICLQADILSEPLEVYVSEWTSEGLGRPPKYVTVPRDDMRAIAISMLKADTPVWFAMDIEKDAMPRTEGILDTHIYDYKETLGIEFSATTDEAVLTQDSAAIHAMVIVGVHLDAQGKAVRWRVMNSWGSARGKKGYLVMTDDWFGRWVYQIAAPRSLVPSRIARAYDEKMPHQLAPWNPLA